MSLSKELQDFAERSYELKAKQITDNFRKQESEARFYSTGENARLQKLLPLKLRAKADALIDCYFEAFQLEGTVPEQRDLVALDKKLENIFCNGHGDYTGSVGVGIVCEVKAIEREVCEQMRLRAERIKIQQRGRAMNVIKIRWSQLGGPKEAGKIRVLGVGDVEVSNENIARAEELGGDPWVDLYDATQFGHEVKTYLMGHLTPA